MTEIISTKKRDYQYNGPVDSSDYNSRIEENYKDLVYLYNRANIVDGKLSQAFERVIKDHKFLALAISDLEDRIAALESSTNTMSIHSFSQIDYASFAGTSYAVSGTELLHFDPVYNVITLPKINSSSFSKLKFTNAIYGQVVPDFFKAKIDISYNGVDTSGAVIDTTPMYNAILDATDKVWKRNVIANSASISGAQMMLYVKIPAESAGSIKSNVIQFNPYPMFSVDIVRVEYTTKINPTLTESDGWTSLNKYALYDQDASAIGKVAPGGWSVLNSDTIQNSGPLYFQIPDTDITGIRIKFNQKNYLIEAGKYIYTYGLSDMDVRYDKFLPSGRSIFKFTPKNGDLISSILSVTPKIYNVSPSLLGNVFSYRILYGTPGVGGTVYSEDNPGSSDEVWIEVTLNMLDDKTAPILTDLVVDYEPVA